MFKQLRSKTLMSLSLIIVFLFTFTGTLFGAGVTTASAATPKYDYVALGDSVPWGYQLSAQSDPSLVLAAYTQNLSKEGGVDLSKWGYPVIVPSALAGYFATTPPTSAFYPSISRYPNIIAGKLGDKLGTYTNLSMPGLTTRALLTTLSYHADGTPISVYNYDILLPNYAYVRNSIINGEIVTLTVGADDILTLPAVQNYMEYPSDINLTAAKAAVLKQLPKTATNLTLIIAKIKLINPRAKIYVMGYYNSFPNNSNAQLLVKGLNTTIQSAVNTYKYSAVAPKYVNTWGAVTSEMIITGDIHVNDLGQGKIADSFWEKIGPSFGF